MIGTEYAINSKDGHTLLMASQSSLLPKFTHKSIRYDHDGGPRARVQGRGLPDGDLHEGYLPVMWSSLFMPKGTPQAVIDRVGRDVLKVVSDPATKEKIEATLSANVMKSSPEQFAAEYRAEAEEWQKLLKSMNFKLME